MNAVDSEHKKNLQSDLWRFYQLTKSESHPSSIYNSFSTGDRSTLDHPSIRSDLLDFHKKWYSSNLMKLVLYSNQSLDELEKLTIEMFSDVKN